MDAWLLVYAAIGAVFGFLAGLLGIGGGAVSVPLTTMAFAASLLGKGSSMEFDAVGSRRAIAESPASPHAWANPTDAC